MADAPPTISTHVLDTLTGQPATGVPVRLTRVLTDGAEVEAGAGTTDADGRIRTLLHGELTAGDYRLRFDLTDVGGGFFTGVALDLHIDDAGRSHHVPLLLAPFAMTSYRGS
jgi:5-hydroxyisourate hydrolase